MTICRTYLEGLLKEEYLVQTCSNGRDALLVAREYNPDLILSDVMMPEMGGDELCASVKSVLRHPISRSCC